MNTNQNETAAAATKVAAACVGTAPSNGKPINIQCEKDMQIFDRDIIINEYLPFCRDYLQKNIDSIMQNISTRTKGYDTFSFAVCGSILEILRQEAQEAEDMETNLVYDEDKESFYLVRGIPMNDEFLEKKEVQNG